MFGTLGGWLLDPGGLTPHGFCLLWEPGLVWTYALADTGIGLAYFTIPLALATFARRRRDLSFRPLLWLFVGFIMLCGATHFLDVLTLWVPAYGLEGAVKAATAVVSIVTAIALWKHLPAALALPSPTQLRQSNVALRESEARHRANFEQSPVPMQILNESGIVTGVSQSWLALFGYAEHEVVGNHIADFLTADAAAQLESDLRKLQAEGTLYDLERRYVRRDGAVLDILVSVRLERREGAASIICVLIDVTERRRAEQALRASEERLHQSQKMEAVGQLTGGIAHDFNNMLQSISGSLELIERCIARGRPADAGRFIRTARKAADNAAALTNRMLAFARRQALQPTVIDPPTLLRDMTDLIKSGVGPSVQVKLKPDAGRWSVACDANQLETALLNLALNARDAMPNGGTLTFETADRSLTFHDLADQDDVAPGDYVEIAVSDTGSGMTPEVVLRAFEPFFTTRQLGHGTGLGLSQVYGFVRQSGGFVRLESRLGHGTTVRLFLPRQDRAPSKSIEAGAAARHVLDPGLATGGTILLVEDDDRVREMVASILTDLGYTVLEAEDGPSGLRIVQSPVELDLLITDVGLPGMNGRQLADKSRASRPRLRVLFITGYAGSALDDTEFGPGTEVLRKPFAFDTLIARVRTMIEDPVVSTPAPAAQTDRSARG